MQYGCDGKRIKKPHNRISWVHTELKLKNFNLTQCFFGEHLINVDTPICIVEAEKTAIICSILLPQYTWIASGGKNGARWSDPSKFKPLYGCDVILYPDLGAYAQWKEKAARLKAFANVSVSTILEDIADEEARPDRDWETIQVY